MTELIVVHFVRLLPSTPYVRGDRAAFTASRAAQLVEDGYAVRCKLQKNDAGEEEYLPDSGEVMRLQTLWDSGEDVEVESLEEGEVILSPETGRERVPDKSKRGLGAEVKKLVDRIENRLE